MNKKLLSISLFLLPIAVISFIFNPETNFNLEKSEDDFSTFAVKTDDVKTEEVKTVVNEVQEKKESNKSSDVSIRVLMNNNVVNIPLEEYIVGVVAAEMPASFDIEALKAQAVASRSYALFKQARSKNKKYDVTADTRTQAYISNDAMKKKWGNSYQKYYDKISKAVSDTSGEVATYNGKVAETLFSAMSGGKTQDVQDVWGNKIDYLVAVESKYDNESLRSYKSTRTISKSDVIKKLNLTCSNPKVDYIKRNDSNYVTKISICGSVFTGEGIRCKLGLKSSMFDIIIGNNVVITTYGYGHGVGMSQYGANGYAEHGYTYVDIIKHYYKNVEISNIKDV